MRINAEPLLINRVGGLDLASRRQTQVKNMFLAGDYVATMTNLATMEGANEAARTAVNEIVLASGVQSAPVRPFPLKEPLELFRSIDEILFKKNQRFEDTYADIPVRIVAGPRRGHEHFRKDHRQGAGSKEAAMSVDDSDMNKGARDGSPHRKETQCPSPLQRKEPTTLATMEPQRRKAKRE